MLRRYRAYMVVFAAGVVLTASAAVVYEIETARIDNETTTGYQPARNARLGLQPDPPASPTTYVPNCYTPATAQDTELCAEWSGVETSEQANRLSTMALKLSALEFGGLILTLLCTAWAALAAVKATEIAEEATRGADAALAIAERNAEAATKLAETAQQTAKTQLRAYVSVLIGDAKYQDNFLRLGASPILVNRGSTPARNLRYRIAAAILPLDLPVDFRFPLPKRTHGSNILGPNQDGSMVAVVADRIPAEEVDGVKAGAPNSLYVWGTLSYEDVFGKLHRNTFAQRLYWTQSGPPNESGVVPEIIRGWFLHVHNRSN